MLEGIFKREKAKGIEITVLKRDKEIIINGGIMNSQERAPGPGQNEGLAQIDIALNEAKGAVAQIVTALNEAKGVVDRLESLRSQTEAAPAPAAPTAPNVETSEAEHRDSLSKIDELLPSVELLANDNDSETARIAEMVIDSTRSFVEVVKSIRSWSAEAGDADDERARELVLSHMDDLDFVYRPKSSDTTELIKNMYFLSPQNISVIRKLIRLVEDLNEETTELLKSRIGLETIQTSKRQDYDGGTQEVDHWYPVPDKSLHGLVAILHRPGMILRGQVVSKALVTLYDANQYPAK